MVFGLTHQKRHVVPIAILVPSIWTVFEYGFDPQGTKTKFEASTYSDMCNKYMDFGLFLDGRLREKFLKHWKGVLSIHFRVCVYVRPSVRGVQGTSFDIGT